MTLLDPLNKIGVFDADAHSSFQNTALDLDGEGVLGKNIFEFLVAHEFGLGLGPVLVVRMGFFGYEFRWDDGLVGVVLFPGADELEFPGADRRGELVIGAYLKSLVINKQTG